MAKLMIFVFIITSVVLAELSIITMDTFLICMILINIFIMLERRMPKGE